MLDILNHVRQNHALEHATVHVLSRRNPYTRFAARSAPAGFYVFGALDTLEVANAATEALARLQQGEAHLAVHPRCGTNLAVTAIMAGLAAYGATLGRPRSKLERLPAALTAAMVAALIAQPLGQTIQERITTTPDVEDLFIDEVERQERGSLIVHKVLISRE